MPVISFRFRVLLVALGTPSLECIDEFELRMLYIALLEYAGPVSEVAFLHAMGCCISLVVFPPWLVNMYFHC